MSVGCSANDPRPTGTQPSHQESDRQFRAAFENAGTGMCFTGPDGAFLEVNRALCDMLGYSEEELASRNYAAVTHPEDLALSQECARSLLADERGVCRFEKRYLRRDVEIVWAEVSTSLLRDGDGHPLYFITQIHDITDRKRAEAALRESEERYRGLFESLPGAVMVVDRTGLIVQANPAAREILGLPAAEAVPLANLAQVWEIVLEDGTPLPGETRPVEVALRTGQSVRNLVLGLHGQGGESTRWVLINCEPLLDSSTGEVMAVIANFVDITDRRRAAQAVQETLLELQRLVAVVTASSVVFFISRAGDRGGIEFVSGNIEQFGYSADDLTTRRVTWAGIMHPEDVTRASIEADDYITQGRREFTVAYRVTTAGGDVRWVEETTIVGVDADGIITGYAGLLVDVTDRKRAELVLRESERRFREMTDLLPDMVFELDPEFRVTYINRAVGEDLGYAPTDLRPDSVLADVMDEGTLARAVEDLAIAVAAGRSLVGVYDVRRRDGTRIPGEFHAMRVLGPDGELVGYRGVVRDITDRQKAEDSQRLAAVGQLAAGVAHEFNNLLAGLMLQAELAAADGSAERYDGLVRVASSVASRGGDICRNLTTFARPADPCREALEVETMIEAALALSAQQIENSTVVVTRDYQTGGWGVMADRRQVEQVFLNLFVNACHAMPRGGRLSIETRHVPHRGTEGEVVVTVTDTGIGIEQTHLPRVFEPFFTTKGRLGNSDTPGAGLGLSVSHGIIQAHDGRVSVRSELGAGTTFELVLPACAVLAPTQPSETAKGCVASPTPAPRAARVLLAEDNLTVIDIIQAFLTVSGHEVCCVHTAQEAVSALRADHYDLVITDLLMPGGGGRGVIEFVRSTPEPPPVLVITGATQEQGEEARAMGASRVIHKPFSHADLIGAVDELLASNDGSDR